VGDYPFLDEVDRLLLAELNLLHSDSYGHPSVGVGHSYEDRHLVGHHDHRRLLVHQDRLHHVQDQEHNDCLDYPSADRQDSDVFLVDPGDDLVNRQHTYVDVGHSDFRVHSYGRYWYDVEEYA